MKTKILILLAVIAVLLSSCYRAREIRLTEAQMQIIPYRKGQVVSFIFGAGQAVDLTVTERVTGWLHNQPDDTSIEAKRVVLKSELNCLVVNINLWADGVLMIRAILYNSLYERVTFHHISIGREGNFLNGGWNTFGSSSIFFHENLKINNNLYFDVVEINRVVDADGMPEIPGRPETQVIPIQLFYNKTYGILQINRDGRNFLTINH